jgi:hypothetical protein
MMRDALKKSGMAALAAATVAVGSLTVSSPAEARRGGWVGPAIVGGVALGALAAASAPRYGYAYGYGPSYGYYDCPRRVVGYNAWGRPIFRRVCY